MLFRVHTNCKKDGSNSTHSIFYWLGSNRKDEPLPIIALLGSVPAVVKANHTLPSLSHGSVSMYTGAALIELR
jgi:hypothetical protein